MGLVSGMAFLLKGGFMMWPLLGSGLVALTVIFERLYVFTKQYATPTTFTQTALGLVKEGKLSESKTFCQTCATPVSDTLLSGMAHLNSPLDVMALSMKNTAEGWVPLLEKRLELLDTIITAAPLMGLLGTITGMMSSFQVLSEKGVNEPNAITGGVSEALIATATGLVIALVCLVAYNYLSSRLKAMIYDMESAGSRLTECRLDLQ